MPTMPRLHHPPATGPVSRWPLGLLVAAALAVSGSSRAAPAAAPATSTVALGTPATVAARAAAPQPGMVVASGTVPDEATRQSILARLRELYGRELYGSDRVVDQLGVAPLPAPPNWSQHVQRLLGPDLKLVSKGQLSVQGNVVELKGEVQSEAQRQAVVNVLSTQVNNPTYTIRNGLRVAAAGQELVDAALANRIIEFETGSAQLTAAGQSVLDQLTPVLRQLQGRRFEIIGHTDGLGARSTNVALSLARAESVRTYLVAKGMGGTLFSTSGVGPDRPLAANDTAEGRARNRRIEFRVGQ
jgi:OmpA-OmpF porin, OOP family